MDRLIPPARWDEFEGLAELVAALGDGTSRVVGGAVRDTLLGREVTDVDLATRLQPEETVARVKAAGLKAVPTGIKHGTITAVLASGRPIEVTTLRRDVETDGRHAVVAFTDDWREDAARRDFTINALYADVSTGELFDYHGGLDDLAAGRVRFIGDPYQRIAEDHLRILRYFRFHARFGDALDEAGLDARFPHRTGDGAHHGHPDRAHVEPGQRQRQGHGERDNRGHEGELERTVVRALARAPHVEHRDERRIHEK